MRKMGQFLLKRNGYAASVALFSALLPLIGVPIGFLSVLIVGLVTLCRGSRSGLFVVAWVALPALALLYLHRFSIVDSLFLDCVIIWLLASILRGFNSWNWVLEAATLLGILIVAGTHLFLPNVESWWFDHLTKYIHEMRNVTSWSLTESQTHKLITQFIPIATGSFVLVGLFWSWLILIMARWWQSLVDCPEHLHAGFISIRNRISTTLIVPLAIIGVLFKQAVLIDMFPVLLFPIMMGGLSVLHYIAAMKKGFVVLVVLVYLSILLLPFIVVILLALIGFFDAWINFRNYLKAKRGVA